MVQNPAQFDVIVTNNLFATSSRISARRCRAGWGSPRRATCIPDGLDKHEPVHGSAPPLRPERREPDGRHSLAALMLHWADPGSRRDRRRGADAVASGQGTAEIGGSLGTRETGDYIAHIRRTQMSPRSYESPTTHEAAEPDRM
jgi:3-isopropylmalate dehydrogenase